MPVVGRLNQYASMLASEFDETTSNNPSITGFGTYFSSEFSENIGISTTLVANTFPPYDPIYDEFGGTLFGAGQGRYMRQNTDKSVIVYNEIDEITDLFGRGIVRNGLVLDLDAGISASYPGSGTTWTDLSVYGNNGTLTNGPTFSSSNGGSIVFDGVDDFVNFGNILNFTSQNFTFTMFLYLISNPPALGYFVCGNGTYQSNGYNLFINNTRNFGIVTNQSGVSQISNSTSLVVGNWYGLSLVRNGPSCRTYVNGVDSTSTAGTHINPVTTTANFSISSTASPTNIRISSLQTYNRALTATEIAQNYNALKYRFGL